MHRPLKRGVTLLLCVCVVGGAGVSQALAFDSGWQAQNPALSARLVGPDTAAVGGEVIGTATVRNTTRKRQSVTATVTVRRPDGTVATQTLRFTLDAYGDASTSAHEIATQAGTYTTTFTVADRRGRASTASGITEVQ